jgi:hypothetical protein
MPITAVAMTGRAERGTSQAWRVRASDGREYWVKFHNNPQGTHAIIHEWICGRLARFLGFPVPRPTIIEFTREFIKANPQLRWEDNPYGEQKPCAGPHFASPALRVLDPEHAAPLCVNKPAFAGMLAFDLWTDQSDQRQVVYIEHQGSVRAVFIDFGLAFNGNLDLNYDYALEFPDGRPAPFSPGYDYGQFTRWESFEPWLSRMEQIRWSEIKECASGFPSVWLKARGPRSEFHSGTPATQLSIISHSVQQIHHGPLGIRERLSHFVRWSEEFPRWSDTLQTARRDSNRATASAWQSPGASLCRLDNHMKLLFDAAYNPKATKEKLNDDSGRKKSISARSGVEETQKLNRPAGTRQT